MSSKEIMVGKLLSSVMVLEDENYIQLDKNTSKGIHMLNTDAVIIDDEHKTLILNNQNILKHIRVGADTSGKLTIYTLLYILHTLNHHLKDRSLEQEFLNITTIRGEYLEVPHKVVGKKVKGTVYKDTTGNISEYKINTDDYEDVYEVDFDTMDVLGRQLYELKTKWQGTELYIV